MGDNPYAGQTETNTGSTKWLESYQKVEADFHTLSQYALNMYNAGLNLLPTTSTFYSMPQLTQQAFIDPGKGVQPLPEGQLASMYLNTNFKDLMSMLYDLFVGLQNTGYAAQTISDAYGLSDTTSADTLNRVIKMDGVDFAMARGGERPPGLDPRIGKTWLDMASPNNQAAMASGATDPTQLGGTTTVTYSGPSDHQSKITTITYTDGSVLRITQTSDYYGNVTTYTDVVGSDGKTVSSTRKETRTVGGKTTVTTATQQKDGSYQDSSSTTSEQTTDSDGNKTTTKTESAIHDGQSTPHKTTTTSEHSDGSSTTTTETTRSDGTTTTDTQARGDDDDYTGDQEGDLDPKHAADEHYRRAGQDPRKPV